MSAAAARCNWRWPALTAGAVLLAFAALLLDERLWSALGVLPLQPHFSDWLAILAAADAQQAGADVYATPNPFDPFGRPHVYGPWWLWLGNLGFTVADHRWMGALLAGVFIATAATVLAPRTWRQAALAVALLLSPPVLLGLERANNDLVVFLLLAATAWLVARFPRQGVWAATGMVWLAAALKIYPAAALAALPAASRQRGPALLALAGGVAACALVAWWYQADYARVLALAPREISVFTYGFKVLAHLVQNIHAINWPLVLGLGAGLALGGIALVPRWRALWTAVPLHGGTAFAFVAGASCWVFCYFVNSNFSYRAVLLLLPARLWLHQLSDPGHAPVARRWLALTLLLLWTACATAHLGEWVEHGRAALQPLWLVVIGFEQALTLMVTVALLLALIGWALRLNQSRRSATTGTA